MERYRSGHNGADSKSVCAKAHEGSNPSLSATEKKKASHSDAFFLWRRREYREILYKTACGFVKVRISLLMSLPFALKRYVPRHFLIFSDIKFKYTVLF